jgi:hypothetical protein
MPHFVPGDFHVDKLLSNVGLAWRNKEYIGTNILPTVNVKNETDLYAEYDKADWFRDEVRKRAAGTPAARIGLGVTLTASYTAEEYAIAAAIPWRVKNNADSILSLNTQVTQLLADAILRARERRISTLLFEDGTASNWTSNTALTGNNQWNNYTAADSTPISDIDTGIKTVIENTAGHYPTDIVMGKDVYWKLRRHPEIIDHAYAGGDRGPKTITPGKIGEIFGIPNVHVGYARYNTSAEGATASYSDIWGKHCWIGFNNKTPSMWTPSAVYQFRVRYRVRSWFNDEDEADIIEAGEIVDEKLISASCGYLITSAVA